MSTIDIFPGLIATANIETGYFIECNEAVTDILGYSVEEFTSKPLVEFIHPDDRQRTIDEINRQLQSGLTICFQIRYQCKDNSYKWLSWQGTAADEDGKVYAVATDITEFKQAEADLEVSEKKFRSTVEGISDGFFILKDEDLILTYFNSSAEEILGREAKDVLGKPIFDAFPEAKGSIFEKQYRRAFDTKVATSFETYFGIAPYANWFDVRVHPVDDGISVFFQRTTERKQAEEKTRKLSQAVEQAGESVIITDAEGSIEYVNPSFTRMTGYSAEEVLGENPRILKSGNQSDEYYKELWNTITDGRVFNSSIIDRRKDGSQYPATMSIAPILNDEGSISHYVALQQDMTDHDMLEEQFRQSQKMEALGTLVGGIAHDFNNMLAGITGNLYLAKQSSEGNPKAIEKLRNIEGFSYRAADMIQQLLTFARKDRVSMKPFPFTPFIKETIKLLHSSIPENITLGEDVCADELIVKGDATQIHQVLLNLVNNACDALEWSTEPRITIRLEALQVDETFIEKHMGFATGVYAHLSVQDNGCGVPENRTSHLFEPFFTTKEVGKGTGLGLAMVFGSVKSHHGFVEVESVEGEGATFHIYLPLVDSEKIADSSKQDGEVTEKGQGETILFVDDQEGIIDTGKEVLESMGYQVMTASNGQQAVDLFKEHPEAIDLIIMDVVMPVMSGDKAAQHIRQIDPSIKIIFSTGYDKCPQIEMSNEIIVNKPFSIEKLSQLIRQTIDT